MSKKRASEDSFNELHNLITEEFLARIKSGEATTQDLKAACDWLSKNDITGGPLRVLLSAALLILCQPSILMKYKRQ